MKWVADTTEPRSLHCIIELDELAGYYLYIYENGRIIRDYLKGSPDIAMQHALREFQIPIHTWKQIE